MAYYKDVIAELRAHNITPMVTLFHWDLPQPLEDEGGWLNETIIEKFNAYADKVFSELGADVSELDQWNGTSHLPTAFPENLRKEGKYIHLSI